MLIGINRTRFQRNDDTLMNLNDARLEEFLDLVSNFGITQVSVKTKYK